MKQKGSNYLGYLIGITIVITIAIQVYWNIQHYEVNKQHLINEVQISLDNGVEAYFANIAKTNIMTFVDNTGPAQLNTTVNKEVITSKFQKKTLDSLLCEFGVDTLGKKNKALGPAQFFDSTSRIFADTPGNTPTISIFGGQGPYSSSDIGGLASKIIIAFSRDYLNLAELKGYTQKELDRKQINIHYAFIHSAKDSIIQSTGSKGKQGLPLSTFSKSTYLRTGETLQLRFNNPTLLVLKRSLTGILLSLLLSGLIMASLFYLLHIIKKQKQLAEIKNDLINNITHEFKTPIATVSTAIEGIKNFNTANDRAKTEKYLDISNQQLQKLHQMVEKLLETATLDSDKLLLNNEQVDIIGLTNGLVEKYQIIADGKELRFSTNISELICGVDAFHFENAVANLIDNALKYGGGTIEVNCNSLMGGLEISVADNGGPIAVQQRNKIFEKFYRIPTGNRHDVKGFGIGLFYTKKIIEKHGGDIQLITTKNNTIFKITL